MREFLRTWEVHWEAWGTASRTSRVFLKIPKCWWRKLRALWSYNELTDQSQYTQLVKHFIIFITRTTLNFYIWQDVMFLISEIDYTNYPKFLHTCRVSSASYNPTKSYKILFFWHCPIKSYNSTKCPIKSYILSIST